LLEAPSLTLDGSTDVAGGAGGDGRAGAGGAGGSGGNINGSPGTDETGNGQSGSGGGGAGGRVRYNASVSPVCAKVSPVASCTSGTMASP
jgi:hypothetical protein